MTGEPYYSLYRSAVEQHSQPVNELGVWNLVWIDRQGYVNFIGNTHSVTLEEANARGQFAGGYVVDRRSGRLLELVEVPEPGPRFPGGYHPTVHQVREVKTCQSDAQPASQDEVRGTRVEHPKHYNHMQYPEVYEVILVLEAWGLDKDFCLGNTIKYIGRAGHKGSPGRSQEAAELEDLKKARWYLDRKIQNLEKARVLDK